MRIALPVLLLCFATPAFGQAPPIETASSLGCGDPNIKFDVKTDRSQHPFAKPDPGKALVYVLQDDSRFFSNPRPTTRFGMDRAWVGATQSNAYFYVSVDPGEHHLCAFWQSTIETGPLAPSAAALHFTAQAGNTYFFIVRDRWSKTELLGFLKLKPVDSDEAQLLMTDFGFSTSHEKK